MAFSKLEHFVQILSMWHFDQIDQIDVQFHGISNEHHHFCD